MASLSPKQNNAQSAPDFFEWAGNFFAGIGRKLIAFMAAALTNIRQAFNVLLSWKQTLTSDEKLFRQLGSPILNKIVRNQFYFTFVQAWPLFLTLFGLLGALNGFVFWYTTQEASGFFHSFQQPAGFLFGFLSMNLAFPLLVIFIITGRSGTAIAVEIGLMKINGQISGLKAIPIQIGKFIILPRVMGLAMAVMFSIIFCDAVAYFFCAGTFYFLDAPFQFQSEFYTDMIDSFSGIDLIFLLIKGAGSGCIIAFMNCLAGLSVNSSPLEVPPASANGTVASLFGVMLPYALLTALQFSLK